MHLHSFVTFKYAKKPIMEVAMPLSFDHGIFRKVCLKTGTLWSRGVVSNCAFLYLACRNPFEECQLVLTFEIPFGIRKVFHDVKLCSEKKKKRSEMAFSISVRV